VGVLFIPTETNLLHPFPIFTGLVWFGLQVFSSCFWLHHYVGHFTTLYEPLRPSCVHLNRVWMILYLPGLSSGLSLARTYS